MEEYVVSSFRVFQESELFGANFLYRGFHPAQTPQKVHPVTEVTNTFIPPSVSNAILFMHKNENSSLSGCWSPSGCSFGRLKVGVALDANHCSGTKREVIVDTTAAQWAVAKDDTPRIARDTERLLAHLMLHPVGKVLAWHLTPVFDVHLALGLAHHDTRAAPFNESAAPQAEDMHDDGHRQDIAQGLKSVLHEFTHRHPSPALTHLRLLYHTHTKQQPRQKPGLLSHNSP